MHFITVTKTASSNSLLKELHREQRFTNPVFLNVLDQTTGRGQQGAVWQSQAFSNLTFSILIPTINLPAEAHFKLNMAVSLRIYEVLSRHRIPNLSLKWPNDIMADGKKIAGVLIENTLSKKAIKDSVIGIGLNVNQTRFENLPKASSLKGLTKQNYNLEGLLKDFMDAFNNFDNDLHNTSFSEIKSAYESLLFRKDQISVFAKQNSAEAFNGIIRGVTNDGLLRVETENSQVEFSLKEVSLKY